MEHFTVTLGFGFRAHPEMFEDWTGLTRGMIANDFEDILTEYVENHFGVVWADFGSNRKSPDDVEYYLMAKDSIRYCDGLVPAPVVIPNGTNYEKPLRESIHKLNVKDNPQWWLGMYEW